MSRAEATHARSSEVCKGCTALSAKASQYYGKSCRAGWDNSGIVGIAGVASCPSRCTPSRYGCPRLIADLWIECGTAGAHAAGRVRHSGAAPLPRVSRLSRQPLFQQFGVVATSRTAAPSKMGKRTKGQTTGGVGNSTSPLVACPATPPLRLRKAIKTALPIRVTRIRRNVAAPRAHAHPKNGYPFDSGERNRPG